MFKFCKESTNGDCGMEITNFDKQFVERTSMIVQNQCTDGFEYNVTLLLNCLVGLVSLPTERTKPGNTPFRILCVEKLKSMGVVIASTNDEKTFRTIKNALSHMYIEPQNKEGLISSVIIKDRKTRKAQAHTELRFTISQLKEFALFVANQHLKRFS